MVLCLLNRPLYLEASRVCEHASLPIDEAVQASHLGHNVRAWAILQVVGVPQDDVTVQIHQLLARQSLHSPCM